MKKLFLGLSLIIAFSVNAQVNCFTGNNDLPNPDFNFMSSYETQVGTGCILQNESSTEIFTVDSVCATFSDIVQVDFDLWVQSDTLNPGSHPGARLSESLGLSVNFTGSDPFTPQTKCFDVPDFSLEPLEKSWVIFKPEGVGQSIIMFFDDETVQTPIYTLGLGDSPLPEDVTNIGSLTSDSSIAVWYKGVCFPQVFGCTDPTACNFFEPANEDNGSCLYNFSCMSTYERAFEAAPGGTVVDVQDLLVLLAEYGHIGVYITDLNNDGVVSTADQLMFLGFFGN
jgi:hypothetical protein